MLEAKVGTGEGWAEVLQENPAPVPVPQLKPAIDPKSSEAAELLVGSFVRLLNQGRLGDAYMLLGPNAQPRAQFNSDFGHYRNLKVKAGAATIRRELPVRSICQSRSISPDR